MALALLGVALLLTMSLFLQQSLLERRLAAHEEALRAIDSTLEVVRAGLPLAAGTVEVDPDVLLGFDESPAVPRAEGLRLWLEMEEESPRGLFRLTVRARYGVRGFFFDRTVETLVWRPR